MWVARDENGDLGLFEEKPFRVEFQPYAKYWDVLSTGASRLQIPSNRFPELTWEDEPLEVELFRKHRIIKKNERNNK